MKTNKMLVPLFILFLILGLFVSRRLLGQNKDGNNDQSLFGQTVIPSPTPIPFAELTIPYLRNKNYQSKLDELTFVYTGSNYNGYLTSYQSDGLKINGLLTKPTGEQPKDGWPAIIFIHGYIPPNQYQTLERYVDYIDYLARNGFVVFKIDLRGNGDSEGRASGAYYSNGYIIDTLNAYSALQGAEFIKSNAIGLWGHSMAGNVVLRSLAIKPNIPAAVIWAGAGYTYTDLLTYRLHDLSFVPQPSAQSPQFSRQRLYQVVGPISDANPFWQQFIPTHYLKDLKGAIEVHHAVDDDVVNIEYSRNLMKLLDATSVPHQFYEYPFGGHNITGSSFVTAMERTVEFYKKYLH